MELNEFITETLKQIIDGVKSAQEQIQYGYQIINPPISSKGKHEIKDPKVLGFHAAHYKGMVGDPIKIVSSVEFDVAVATTKQSKSKRGVGIVVASIGAGTQKQKEQSDALQNRIKFIIPLALPFHEIEQKKD